LYLADPEPDAWVGNLMGDFVKGPVPKELSLALQHGIKLHRAIDTYTDQHPVFLRSKKRISLNFRRYSGILIDMFYDHLLAAFWNDYSRQDLRDFTNEVYLVLRERQPQLPPRMQASVSYILAHDLLNTYREPVGIEQALKGIERRLRRPSNLSQAIHELPLHYSAFRQDFNDFFPQLTEYVADLKPRLHATLTTTTTNT
jgi:acyl carrier protein phosphodiesterase